MNELTLCECGDHYFAPVSGGGICLISPEDSELLKGRTWHATGIVQKRYMQSRQRTPAGRIHRYLHREVKKPSPDQLVDHINHNGLDNRRSNLRFASHQLNTANRRFRSSDSSPFLGVQRKGKRFRAVVSKQQQLIHVGCYDTPEEAAHARDAAARQVYGEFATLNFPETALASDPASRGQGREGGGNA